MITRKRITFEDKLRLAKQAMSLDDSCFDDLAKESGITPDQLAYYTNAYEAAGESGVRALDYKKTMPEAIRKEAMEKLTRYFENRVPEHLRNQIGFQIAAKNNRITIAEKRTRFDDNTKWSIREHIQMAYTDYDNRWHLYWKRLSGRWHPFVPDKEIFTIEDCIREFDGTKAACFWG